MNEFIKVIKTTEDFIKLLTKNPGENLFFIKLFILLYDFIYNSVYF